MKGVVVVLGFFFLWGPLKKFYYIMKFRARYARCFTRCSNTASGLACNDAQTNKRKQIKKTECLLTQFGANNNLHLGDTNPGRNITIIAIVLSYQQTPRLQLTT